MPSSLSFLLYNSSHLLLKNHSKSTNDEQTKIDQYTYDHSILERPSDDEISIILSDDNDDYRSDQQTKILTGPTVELDDKWIRNNLRKDNTVIQSDTIKFERNEKILVNYNQHHILSPSRSKSVNMVDNKQQSRNTDTFLSTSPFRSRINVNLSPIRASPLPTNKLTSIETRRSIPKIPLRSNSLPQSKSLSSSLAVHKRSIPSLSPSISKSPLPFFTVDDPSRQASPIIHSKTLSSSVSNIPSMKEERKGLSSSDDDIDTDNLKEDDLKRKLKEEKRHSKRTEEILNKLHENYEELLGKYAQAENTIDQLRFQPNQNLASLRSSGAYNSTMDSPLSSMRPVSSLMASAIKIESVFNGESTSPKPPLQEITLPETVKLDLLIHTKTLGDNMKSFLTLMDTNQVNADEQKQAYENIKQDYEKLIQTLEQKKHNGGLAEIDLDTDLNKELELMKQLLREIATRITGNLFGKSSNQSPFDRHTLLTYDDSHSSQFDQSSLCNHDDLMDQYKKLLSAVNTGSIEKKDRMKSVMNGLEMDLKQFQTTPSRAPSSDGFVYQTSMENKQKPYVYVSAGSDDEQQQSNTISPIPFVRGVVSTSLDLSYVPSTSVEYHQHKIVEEPNKPDIQTTIQKKNVRKKQEYHKLDEIKVNDLNQSQSKFRDDLGKKIISSCEHDKQSPPLIPNDGSRNSNSSNKTRVNDCDSGIGTNTVTKLTCDSKQLTSPLDESHLQSLDEGRESISSSLRSTGSDSGSLYGKHTTRFHSPALRRRKPSRQSDSYLSDIEPRTFDSLDSLPQPSLQNIKKMHRNHHTWKPQRTSSPHRSRLSLFHRGTPIGSSDMDNYKTQPCHPIIATRIHTNQSFDQPKSRPKTHRSSLFISHTQDKTEPNRPNRFYFDSRKEISYRYPSKDTRNCTKSDCQVSPEKKIHRCGKCGSITPYHHRRHTNSAVRQAVTQVDDPGYESGYRKRSQSCRYNDSVSSSDSDSDLSPNYLQMIALNEAYDQAEKVENCSQRLSKYITRQLKLALTLI